VVVIKSFVFWDTMPCSLFESQLMFQRNTLHPSSESMNKPSKKPGSRACYLLHADFLLGLFLDPQDGGNMFLQNIG
jgi:hypothetical protein